MSAAKSAPEKVYLRLDQIRTDGGTQSRAQLDEATVAEYAELYAAGAPMPAVDVFHDGTEYWLSDGFHRCAGADRAGCEQIVSEIHQGSLRDAILFSCGANGKHGLRRTNADKRRSVERLLRDEEWGDQDQYSDRWVAKQCNVSHHLVASIRVELGNSPNPPTSTHMDDDGDDAAADTAGGAPGEDGDENGGDAEDDEDSEPETDPDPEDGTDSGDQEPEESSEPVAVVTGDPVARLEFLAGQRHSDPEYASLRRAQLAVSASIPSRAQRMIDFALDGVELAMLRLGVDWQVTPETLRHAYRAASLKAHPDRGGSQAEFVALTQARDLVSRLLGGGQ